MSTSRRRVLRVITRLVVSGPATHVILVDRGLRERDWETLLVHGTVEPDEAEIDLTDVDIPRRRVPNMRRAVRPVADVRSLGMLARIIRAYRPDIIHTHQSKAGLLARSAAMLTRSPARRVHTFHGTVFDGYFGAGASSAIRGAERFLARHTDRLVALSEGQRDALVRDGIARTERVAVVPLGLDLARFRGLDRAAARRALAIESTAPLIVWLGRLAPIKRVDRLIDAFGSVLEAHPDARLAIVGDGSLREGLEARAAARGADHAITFAGWSSDSARWYAASDVVALSSDNEGTPLSLIEAAAAARPVVAMDVGGVRDVVDDGVTGFLVPAADSVSLADRISALLADPGLRAAMGASAAMRVDRFGSDRLVQDLDRLYQDLLE
jgi:glycosyltransferase involved in cell wall biosynthesis